MLVAAGLKCNVCLAGSQYYGVIDIPLEISFALVARCGIAVDHLSLTVNYRCAQDALLCIATLAISTSELKQTYFRVWDGGLTVTLEDLGELAELWMGCAAE